MLRSMTLLLFMAAAVTKDMQTYRIPNALLAAGAVNGYFLRFLGDGFSGITDGTAGAALPLVLCAGLFVLSMLGAGDIKLMMVIGIYLGAVPILRVMLYACMIGGGMALVKILGFGLAGQRIAYFLDYFRTLPAKLPDDRTLPYIEMDRLDGRQPWLMHFSVPILLAALFELL